jgi:uncharacterized protein
MRGIVFGTALAFVIAGAAHAGDSPPAPAAVPVTPPASAAPQADAIQADATQAKPSESHIAAALALLDASNSMNNVAQLIDSMWSVEAREIKRAHPGIDDKMLASTEKIIRGAFTARQDEYKRMVAVVYAEHFSEEDLRALAAFYRSDVGKRYVATMPAMIKDMTEVGGVWAQGVIGDIRQKIMDQMNTKPGDHA